METYNKIRFIQFFTIFFVASIFYLVSSANKKIDYEVKQKNIQADREYLNWLVNAGESNLSVGLKDLLKDREKINYLATESQIPFTTKINQYDIDEKKDKLFKDFINKFKINNLSQDDQEMLKKVIQKVIEPEFQFLLFQDDVLDILFNRLALITTPVGTTLQDWLVRFLTSDSLIEAIPMIEKFDGKDKEKNIAKISDIINSQFHDNLIAVQKVFKFELDPAVFNVIKNRMFKFLKAKFIL